MTRPRWAATTSAQRASKSSTRSPIRSSESSLDSAVNDDDVGEPDGQLGGVQVLLAGAQGGHPRDGGREVAAPDVDEQPLEGDAEALDHPHRDVRAALVRVLAGVALLALELLDPVHQGRDLPVREPGHRLADGTGEVDREVEVEQAGVDQPDQRRQRPDVTLA